MGGERLKAHIDEMVLYEYMEELLEADEQAEVANHLSKCATCRGHLAELKLLMFELEHLKDVPIPNELSIVREKAVSEGFETIRVPFLTSIKEKLTSAELKRKSAVKSKARSGQASFSKYSKSILSKGSKRLLSYMGQAIRDSGKKTNMRWLR